VDDTTVKNEVRVDDLSGLSSCRSDPDAGGVGQDGEVLVVEGSDADVGSNWESGREQCSVEVDCVVEDELRVLERVESGQVCSVKSECRVDWSEDGDWICSREDTLSLGGEVVGVDSAECGEVGGQLSECRGQNSERWIKHCVDNVSVTVGCNCNGGVEWVSVDGDDCVVWSSNSSIVVDTECGREKGGEGEISWEDCWD